MTRRFTGQISVEVFDLAGSDLTDLKDRIEEAAAAHKATVTVNGRLIEDGEDSRGEQW